MSFSFKAFLTKSSTGSVLAVVSGLSFFFTCMLLPLVGPSGARQSYAVQNKLAFSGALAVTFVLGALASWSKFARRADDQSPLPYGSLGLCALCIVIFILLITGLLAI